MPFSAGNPNRNRNFVIAALCGTVLICAILGAFVALSLAERDTDEFLRFVTILFATLIPSVIGAWRANTAAHNAGVAVKQTNGDLDARITDAVRDTIRTENIRQSENVSGDYTGEEQHRDR